MLDILKIKKEERVPLAVAAVVAILLNALMTTYHHDLFTRGVKGGFWTIFWGHFHISGYDATTLLTLSKWDCYFTAYRHPLLPFLWWPWSQLNHWLLTEQGVNGAVYIAAVVMTISALCSFLLLYRILHEVVGVSRGDTLLLCALFFSFAHIMLAVMVPEHFGLSLPLLLLTIYVGGRQLRDGRPQQWWQTALLFIATAGVTLSNGAKVLLSAWWTRGRRIMQWRYALLGIVVPVVFICAVDVWQNKAFVEPYHQRAEKTRIANEKKYAGRAEKNKALARHFDKVHGKRLHEDGVLSWTDMSVSRWQSLRHNVFGETFQLHEQHLLQDIFYNRPIFVSYGWWGNDVVGCVLVGLFVLALWLGRRNRLLWMLLSWLACDAVLHLGLGFGLNEVYIMATHWTFIIPIALAIGTRQLGDKWRTTWRGAIMFLAVFLWAWNGRLLTQFFLQ